MEIKHTLTHSLSCQEDDDEGAFEPPAKPSREIPAESPVNKVSLLKANSLHSWNLLFFSYRELSPIPIISAQVEPIPAGASFFIFSQDNSLR